MRLIFVFGSNLAGRHGKGAALYAKTNWGAKQGKGVGEHGQSYAIPTKDGNLNILPLEKIEEYFIEFLEYARQNPNKIYLLTPVGTGLAGYSKVDIGKILHKHFVPKNVVMTREWVRDYV